MRDLGVEYEEEIGRGWGSRKRGGELGAEVLQGELLARVLSYAVLSHDTDPNLIAVVYTTTRSTRKLILSRYD